MKKLTLLFTLFILLISSSVQALSWAYPFVVWKGKVYEVKREVIIEDSEIGKKIGEVRTKPDDMNGNYYGDASNYYLKGTEYYEIKGTSPSSEIAVKEENQWGKAVYVHKAPFHIMNIFSSTSSIILAAVIFLIVVGIKFRTKKSKER